MTECQRLIAEGKLPPEFLEPEMRECEVPSEMKKLWALQIDLIDQVKKICLDHSLTYYACGGTAIGAVRHHGFIPWDDDVDLMMPRADYNTFIEYAKAELKDPYFLQIPTTDKHYYRPFITLRNSNATCISKGDARQKCNNGALIHIFPLDGYTHSFRLRWFIRFARLQNIIALNSYHYGHLKNAPFIRFLLKIITPVILPGGLEKHWLRHQRICSRISKGDHALWGNQYSHFRRDITPLLFDKEIFNSSIWLPFEYSQIPVPVGYDQMLRTSFGDYMQLPPVKSRFNKHAFEIAPDEPYKEYCHRKYGTVYDD